MYYVDEVVSRLSDSILYENLREQVDEQILMSYSPSNVLEIFKDRYNLIKLKYSEDDEVMEKILEEKFSIYESLLEDIETKFDLTTNIGRHEILDDDFFLYIDALYKAFILDYKEKLIDFIVSDINENKEDYIENFKSDLNRKSIQVKSLKRVFKSIDEVVIIVSVRDIVNGIINTNTNSENIMKSIISTDEMESSLALINEIFFEENELMGMVGPEFYTNFFKPLQSESENRNDLIIQITNEVTKMLPKSDD